MYNYTNNIRNLINFSVLILYLLNRLRDLHFSYQRWATAVQKRLSAAFNWDMNRDPSQKVSVDIQLDNKGTWHHAGHVSLYYPGRMLTGDGEFLLKGKNVYSTPCHNPHALGD